MAPPTAHRARRRRRGPPRRPDRSQIRVGFSSTGGLLGFGVCQPRFWRPPPRLSRPTPRSPKSLIASPRCPNTQPKMASVHPVHSPTSASQALAEHRAHVPAPFGLPIVEASTAHGYDRTAKPPHDSRSRSATVGPSHSCWVGPRSLVGPRPERNPRRGPEEPHSESPPPRIPPPGREPLWLRCLQSVRAEVVFPDPRVDRYRRSTRRSGGHMTEHHTYETRAAGDAPSSAPSPPVRRMAGARNCECPAHRDEPPARALTAARRSAYDAGPFVAIKPQRSGSMVAVGSAPGVLTCRVPVGHPTAIAT